MLTVKPKERILISSMAGFGALMSGWVWAPRDNQIIGKLPDENI
jgi:hypothetical protein